MAPSTFLYFAYGSNLLTRRLQAATRAPSARKRHVARLRGHRLTFDKPGSRDGSGKCDAQRTGLDSDVVHGVVYRIALADGARLDFEEGLGHGYDRATVRVEADVGLIECVTYLATRKDPLLRPLCWYKGLVVAGALEHGLPEDYVRWLQSVPADTDADLVRRQQHERLLRPE